MNALKHKKEASKSYREAQRLIVELVEMMAQAYAIELHEQAGFGAERNERIAKSAIERVHKCVERYEVEYTPTALKSKCADFGFVAKVHLNEKGAVTWG